jgi:uncharacterized protein (TIGR00369 family)
MDKEGLLTLSHTNLQARLHPFCVVCGDRNPQGLGLRFVHRSDDTVEAEFLLDGSQQGYTGMPHGGVLASVLDGAMTNWLLLHGIAAVTIELKVQYRHVMALKRMACVEAQLKETTGPLYVLTAQIRQDEQVKAQAQGKFVSRPDLTR